MASKSQALAPVHTRWHQPQPGSGGRLVHVITVESFSPEQLRELAHLITAVGRTPNSLVVQARQYSDKAVCITTVNSEQPRADFHSALQGMGYREA